MTASMTFMTITLTFAGVLQTHLQRVIGMGYMEIQQQLDLFYWMRLLAGVIFVAGAMLYLYAVLGPVKNQLATSKLKQPVFDQMNH